MKNNLLWILTNRQSFVKEVIQPQVPLRLPCYDFTPVIGHTVVTALFAVRLATSGATNSHGVTGGVYKAPGTYSPRHSDPRLLAIPTSWSRVADSIRTTIGFLRLASHRCVATLCTDHCSTCSPGRKGHDDLTSSPPSSSLSLAVSLKFPSEMLASKEKVALVAGLNPTSHDTS